MTITEVAPVPALIPAEPPGAATKPSEVLALAVQVIGEYGWAWATMGNEEMGFCTLGAMNKAVGRPQYNPANYGPVQAWEALNPKLNSARIQAHKLLVKELSTNWPILNQKLYGSADHWNDVLVPKSLNIAQAVDVPEARERCAKVVTDTLTAVSRTLRERGE